MEKVVLKHLEVAHRVHDRLNVNQHAFHKGSSCDSALLHVVDEIEGLILRDHYALGIFLNIKGAFNNLNIELSIQGMLNKGFPPHITRWHSYYLQHQSVETKIKGITATRTITRGTPWGESSLPLYGI